MNKEYIIKGRLFGAVCSKTGAGFNSGFICADGTSFKEEKDLIEDIKRLNPEGTEHRLNEDILEESYNNGEHYFTDYECLEHMQYIEIDNKIYEIEINLNPVTK